MDRYIRIGIIGGSVWSLAGLVLLLLKATPTAVSIPLFDTGVIVLSISFVYAFMRRYRRDSLICDERSMHIVMYGLAYSWFTSLGVGVLLLWSNLLHWLTLTALAVLVIWILSMSISGFIFYLLLAKRGTVE